MVPEAETSDFEELGGMSVERLTVWRKDGRASIANRDGATPLQQTMKITDVIDRLAAIEDILGDEYDLDRLRELAQADKECISPCTFCRFNPPSSGDGKPCCMCPAVAALRREQE
jgi:hypothetical protein